MTEQYRIHKGFEVAYAGTTLAWVDTRIEAEEAFTKATQAVMYKHDGIGGKKVIKSKSRGFRVQMKNAFTLERVRNAAFANF